MGTVETESLWRVQGPPNEPKTDRNPNRNRRQAANPIGWIRVQRRVAAGTTTTTPIYVPPILDYSTSQLHHVWCPSTRPAKPAKRTWKGVAIRRCPNVLLVFLFSFFLWQLIIIDD